MSMYFYDETDDWPEYQAVRDHIQHLEKAHRECRRALQAAESALPSTGAGDDLRIKVETLRTELKAIEKKLDETHGLYR